MSRRLHPSAWAHRRLTDCVQPGVQVLLVGINPGVMSAATGHHFAGPSNRFWKLLYESGLVSDRITHVDDVRLPEWGLGITNLIARPSPGIDDLKRQEYIDGWRVLEEKIARYRPAIVAFIGVTMYRALWKVITSASLVSSAPDFSARASMARALSCCRIRAAETRISPMPRCSPHSAHCGEPRSISSERAE